MKLRLIEIGRDGAPARCPGHIPPSGRDVIEGTVVMYEALGFHPPWIGYLVDRDGDIVGACAFKGPPRDGRADIACVTFPEFEGRGMAGEMARLLVKRAEEADPSVALVAHTPRREGASTAILRDLGFAVAREIEHPDEGPSWEWLHRPRERTDD